MTAQSAKVIQFPQRNRDGEPWEPWITEQALAHHFSVDSRTVRRWRRDGMPSTLFGGARRYRISECERWHSTRETA